MEISVEKRDTGYVAKVIHSYGVSITDPWPAEDEAIEEAKKLVLKYVRIERVKKDKVDIWMEKGLSEICKYTGMSDKVSLHRTTITMAFLHTMTEGKKLDMLNSKQLQTRYKKLATLGDAVLERFVTRILFDSDIDSITNERSKIVCRENLGKCMIDSGFNKYVISPIHLDLSENINVQAEILEAWIGALDICAPDTIPTFLHKMKIFK